MSLSSLLLLTIRSVLLLLLLRHAVVFQDNRGNFHIITHNQNDENVCGSKEAGGSCGAHLFSRDALSWSVGSEAAYNATVVLANGTVTAFATRQRPQLVLNPGDLRPAYLFNGGGGFGSEGTHTYVQAFAGA